MQGNLRKKTVLPFRWVTTAGRTQRSRKEGVCSADLALEWTGCTHIPEIHTSHSIHGRCVSTTSGTPEQKMNLQKPAHLLVLLHQTCIDHKPSAFPPGSSKAVAAKGSSAVYSELLSPLLAETHLQSYGKKEAENRHQWVTQLSLLPITFISTAIQSATIPNEGTRDSRSVVTSTQPSSQSTELLGIHLLDILQGHLLRYTNLFGYRKLPSAPVLYQAKSARTLTARRINITFPSAPQHELPISNNLKMPLSS